MVGKVLAPGMEDHDDAGLGPEVAPVLRKSEKSLRCSPEQERVKKPLVGEEQLIQDVRDREDDMEVSRIEDLASPPVEPNLFEDGLTARAASVAAGAGVKLDVTAFITFSGIVSELTCLA